MQKRMGGNFVVLCSPSVRARPAKVSRWRGGRRWSFLRRSVFSRYDVAHSGAGISMGRGVDHKTNWLWTMDAAATNASSW